MKQVAQGEPATPPVGRPPWFGALPPEWRSAPLRYLVTFSGGGTPDKGKPEYWNGTIPWVSPKDMKQDAIGDSEDHITEAALDGTVVQLLPPQAVLIVVRGMILARTLPVAVTTDAVTINQDIKALRCGPSLLPRFLQAVLQGQSHWLLAQADQSAHGTKKLETDVLRQFETPCPSLTTQQQVVSYLERETGRIDALIAAKEHQLDLLAEKRHAVISEAVTRGLDPAAPVRSSGLPWLGDVPAHWQIWKLGHVARVGNGSTPNRDNPKYWQGGSIPWLNSAVAHQPEVTSSEQFITDLAFRECHLPLLRPGTVLVAITGQGKTRGQATVLSLEATINQHLAYVALDQRRLTPWFLRWLFLAAYDFLRSISDDSGGTKGALTCEELAGLRMPIPPIAEQNAISEWIGDESAKLDAVRAATKRTIELLRERRAALIAAAVTGQFEAAGNGN